MRRALRIAAWSVCAVLLLAVLSVTALIVAGNTRAGRHVIEHETAQLSSGRMRIAGLGGRFPSRIDIASIQLSDSRGPWLRAAHVSLRWSPLALLAWNLHVERFDIGQVDVLRRPVPSRSSRARGPSHLPAIDIDHFRIHTLQLEPAAAGTLARLNVRGSLHYRSMTDARATLLARRTNGMGLYSLRLRTAPAALTARVKVEEPADGPLQHWLKLPGLGPLALEASIEGPPHAETLRLSAHAGKLDAQAHGTLDLGRRSADLTYAITSAAMQPRPGVSWRHIALHGHWHGPLATAQANGTLNLQGLRLANGLRLGTLTANLTADGQVLTVHATGRHIRLPGPHPRLLRGSPLSVEATLQLHAARRPLQLAATDRLFSLRARLLTAGARSAAFDLRLPRLSPLAALYHERIHGTLRLVGTIAQHGTLTRLAVRGAGRVRGAGVAARLLGSHTRLRLEASLTSTKVRLRRFTLSGRAITVSATARAERNPPGDAAGAVRAVHARWRLSLSDLARVVPAASGSLVLTGSAQGPWHALTLLARAHSRLSLHGEPPESLQATVRARGLPSATHAELRVGGTLAGAPVALEVSLVRSATHTYDLDVRRMTWRSVSLTGRLRSGSSLASTRGQLRLSIARLADLRPLLATALSGRLDGTLALAPVAGRAGARMLLVARHLEAHGLKGDVRLSAVGPLDALRLRLAAESPDVHGAPANLTATARLDRLPRSLDLRAFAAHYRGQTLQLLSPSQVTWSGGLAVRNLRLGIQRTVIALNGRLSPTLDVRASLHRLDAGVIDAFAPHLLSGGTLSAEARLKGRRTSPVGHVSLELTGLRFAGPETQGLPAVNLRSHARLRAGVAAVSAVLVAGPASRLSLSGRTPLNRAGRVALTLTGTMNAALMNAILEARGERAAGTLTVDARVSGRERAPRIRGVVTLANGDLRDYAEGVHIGDINARLVGDQGVLRISSLTARAGPGHLSATGTIGILQPRMPIDVSLIAHRIRPITNDILTADLGADIHVVGTLRDRVNVTGTIHLHHAEISIPNGLPPNVATLDVIRPGQAVQPVRAAHRLVIGLGLTLDAPRAIFVRGRGLDAQLGGKLEIAGTSAHPRVSGGFSMTRGTFSLAGTNLDFTSGRVSFNGEGLRHRIDPTLDFVAQSSVMYTSATTVTLRVTGFADDPRISLTSSPQLPQDDLLALLLFGEPASQLSPYQLGETGAALATLDGLGGSGASSLNPLTWIRRHLDLNTLSVASGQPTGATGAAPGTRTGGASVTAGKYLSNNIYVAATHTTQGTSQIRVDIDLSRHLKLETRLGNGTATTQGTTPQNDPGSSIGLAYQLRY